MPIEITTALIGIIGILLGAWGGAAISRNASIRATESANRNAIEIMRRQELSIATAKLRSAFAPAIAFIYIAKRHGSNDRPDVDAYIKNAILAHGSAVEEFRPFVPSAKSSAYQEAWEKYREVATKDQYDFAADARFENTTTGELIEKCIQNILNFLE